MHRFVLAGILALGVAAYADVPRTVGFQGRLAGANGTPKPDGAYSVRFALYNLPEGVFTAQNEFHTINGDTVPLGYAPTIANSETIAKVDGTVTYTRGGAYTVDYPNGIVTRANASAMPDGTWVYVSYQYTAKLLWEETKNVSVVGGQFTTALGDTVAIPGSIWPLDSIYVGVKVGADPEMTPRLPVRSVPFAQAVRGLRIIDSYRQNVVLADAYNTAAPGIWGATIGGGSGNSVSSQHNTVAGGAANKASGDYGTIGGGRDNVTGTYESTVGGGRANQATGGAAVVGGGYANVASGGNATIPGGIFNEASGANSFAAGRRAKARETGAFVWADTLDSDLPSFGDNTFTARASGGFRLYTNNAGAGAHLLPNEGSWSSLSDRNAKEDIAPIDTRAILDRLSGVPIQTWRYRNSPIRHIGPMAQDFAAAFQVGEDDRHISAVDADGVALAAVQALYRIVQEKDAELAALRARLDRLEGAEDATGHSGASR